MKKFYILLLLLLSSCGPSKKISVSQSLPPLDPDTPVEIYSLAEEIPIEALVMGTVKAGDTGFSVNCNYDKMLEVLKQQAREVGGNALKIPSIKLPRLWVVPATG